LIRLPFVFVLFMTGNLGKKIESTADRFEYRWRR